MDNATGRLVRATSAFGRGRSTPGSATAPSYTETERATYAAATCAAPPLLSAPPPRPILRLGGALRRRSGVSVAPRLPSGSTPRRAPYLLCSLGALGEQGIIVAWHEVTGASVTTLGHLGAVTVDPGAARSAALPRRPPPPQPIRPPRTRRPPCAHVQGACAACRRAGPGHRQTPGGRIRSSGFQFIDGRRAWHQGEQETLAAIIEHRAAGLSWAKVAAKAQRHQAPHSYRRPVDTARRRPGPPGART